jgi:uracil-DNA glycosylase family 4
MDALALLALQIEWGADEALDTAPVLCLHSQPAAVIPAVSVPIMVSMVAPIVATAPAVPAERGPVVQARAIAEQASDLDALRIAIIGFEGCALRDTATNPVLASGAVTSGLAIVGEVPDEQEDRAGHPFAGRSGELLDRMLASIGLERSQLLLLPLIPWRPPGNRPPSALELSVCLPFLHRALVLARPNLLLLMGSRPVRELANSTIRANAGWRATTLPGLPEGTRTLAMRHPSYLLSHLPARREAWTDLLRVRRTLDDAEVTSSSITSA